MHPRRCGETAVRRKPLVKALRGKTPVKA
ncbi:hypothetical protein F383_37194 [Gossypium arboreum]|uniref:Uncharacterized protein n=1 Tax=Gossypium arboreum TaxID=29729 RepID=A0A0B0MEA6_GOSAR|nr:hypothetical protein F383_37194 [Gossypium arboreum]